ncbi:MAG TPA: glycosyltransferase [Fibrobacteraceae bacterium]|nr:glycosyltransferase [Fibrobacteraceae bacterium]
MPSLPPSEVQKRLGSIVGALPRRGRRNTLSVCMIVKDEEKNIERAIRSFLPFADEIVVNDTGSTDRTLEILSSLPKVKIIHSEWKRDFSYARNLSLEAATCSWCLWMDADDVVPPEQVINFNKLKRAPRDRAFGFQVINTQGGGKPVGARFLQIRMFPNHPRLRFERRIHEQILFSVASLGLHVFYVDAEIWHMGYESEAMRRAKSERNLELILTEPDRGVDPVISTQLGDAYMILGRYDESIAAFREVLEIPHAQEINADAYREAFINIGKAYQHKHDYSESIRWLDQAIKNEPQRIDPSYYKAECLFRTQQYDDAESWFEKILQMKRTHSSQASHWDVMRMYSFKYLCDIATTQQDANKLLKWGKAFLEAYPQVIEASTFTGKAFLALGDAVQAIPHLEKSVGTNPGLSRETWAALILAYEKTGDRERLESARQRMSQAFGDASESAHPVQLSVVLIVKNEEDHLGACLESIRGLWDDLVVVDTGSTDRTIEIAHAAGARVVEFSWIGDFSAARNRSLEEARGQWILWLDADDIVLPVDRTRIYNLVSAPNADKAYGFLIKNSQDRGLTGPVFNQIRLFPNHPSIRFQGRVHEQVMPSLQTLGMPVEFLDVRIIHTGYTDPETVRQKQRRNLELMKTEIELSPQSINAMKYFALGNAYLDLGDYEEAAQQYRASMAQAERLGEDRHILEVIPVKLAECRANQGFKDEALAMMNQYLQRQPTQPNALYLRAKLNEALEQQKAAALDYGCLVHFQEQPTLMPVDYQQIRIHACKMLGNYWMAQGQRDLAVAILRMGVAVGKGENQSGLKFASLYFEHAQYGFCRESLRFARLLEETPTVLYSLGQVMIMLNDVKGALEALECGVRKFPQDSLISKLLIDLKTDLGLNFPLR